MSRAQTQSLGRTSGLNTLVMAAVIGASTASTVAADCTSNRDIAASRARWTMVLDHSANRSSDETNCRRYAGSFYGLVTLRQDVASCIGDADRDRKLAALDSEIDAFNNLLATRCSG